MRRAVVLAAAAVALASGAGAGEAAPRIDYARVARNVLPPTMRFANRPTFQQVLTFSGHRPR